MEYPRPNHVRHWDIDVNEFRAWRIQASPFVRVVEWTSSEDPKKQKKKKKTRQKTTTPEFFFVGGCVPVLKETA